jgi:glutathione S-transferase
MRFALPFIQRMALQMKYQLYYWGGIPGRGEFVRLALEDAGATYTDMARTEDGEDEMIRIMQDDGAAHPSFAPPFLKAGALTIGQVANILLYLGDKHGLAPKSESGRLWTHQLQLTIADLVAEIHDSHHPIAGSLYYDQQKEEASRRTRHLREERLPKYLGYFNRLLEKNGGWLAGKRVTYADLSLFQIVEGLRFAFPGTMKKLERRYRGLTPLRDRVAGRRRIAAYLESDRRQPFNNDGIFRHYPELDG